MNAMLDNILPVSARAAGLRSDTAEGKHLAQSPLESIRAPTLIVSTRDDGYGTYASAQYTASRICEVNDVAKVHVGIPSSARSLASRRSLNSVKWRGMSTPPSAVNPPPLGSIEPHAGLLAQPPEDQLLYKIMTVENLLRSIDGVYLHLNRVESYGDGPGADPSDGAQLPKDQPGNTGV